MDFTAWMIIAAIALGLSGHGLLMLLCIVLAFMALETP